MANPMRIALERAAGSRQAAGVDDHEGARESARAAAYAAWARSGQDQSFAPALDAVVELLPPPPRHVLDVGCGEGRLGKALIAHGYDVVGVDLDPTMVAFAAEHHPAQVADAAALPFASEQFDAAVSVHTLMEITDLDAALTEISRVTRHNGHLVLVIEHPLASGRRVDSYSQPQSYSWPMSYEGADLGLGGIHRPISAYVRGLERAGFALASLRETALPSINPLSLVLSATRVDSTR